MWLSPSCGGTEIGLVRTDRYDAPTDQLLAVPNDQRFHFSFAQCPLLGIAGQKNQPGSQRTAGGQLNAQLLGHHPRKKIIRQGR